MVQTFIKPARTMFESLPKEGQVNFCHGTRDGDCFDARCPQLRDNEPYATGRHCPLDVGCPRCLMQDDACEC